MKRDTPVCSNCRAPRDRHPQRYCSSCHAAYMRAHRPKHREMSSEARRRANARAYARVYEQRGKLKREPCEVCGATEQVQKHHDDYGKPLQVRWLCFTCHLDEHGKKPLVRRGTLEINT